MRGRDPAISVVIPCRNEAGTLQACLDALAHQDFPPSRYEVLVVDGRSSDGCREIASACGVRILEDPGVGPSAARNVGIAHAKAPIVAFTDADCVPERDWLGAIRQVFAERPWIAGVGGAIRMPRRTLLGRMEDDAARARYRGVITSNVSYRRDALRFVGGFDETLRCAEDFDLCWRLRDAGLEVRFDERPLVMHAPPEIEGPVSEYLRKQFWYARHDVATHVQAWKRHRADRLGTPGSREGVRGFGDAAKPAAALLATGGALLTGRFLLAASAATALAARAWRQTEPAGMETVPRLAICLAKEAARGAGTLAGLAGLARREAGVQRRTGNFGVKLAPRAMA